MWSGGGGGRMMHRRGKRRRRKSNVVYIPMTHVWNFFDEYLFILENEIMAFFNLIVLNFNIQRTSMQSTPFFLCVFVIIIQ
jgi:hypothetical protein